MPWVLKGSEDSYRDPLLEEGLEYLKDNDLLSLPAKRVLAVLLKMQGVNEHILAATFHVSTASIFKWQKLVREEGWQALENVGRKGKKTVQNKE